MYVSLLCRLSRRPCQRPRTLTLYVSLFVTQVVQTALSETQDPDIVCMCHCLSPRWSRRPCQRPRTQTLYVCVIVCHPGRPDGPVRDPGPRHCLYVLLSVTQVVQAALSETHDPDIVCMCHCLSPRLSRRPCQRPRTQTLFVCVIVCHPGCPGGPVRDPGPRHCLYVSLSVTQVVQTALSETQDPDIVCMCHCLSPRWSRRPCQRPRTLTLYVCVSVTQVVQTALSETQDPDIVCMCHCLSPRWSRRPCQRPRTLTLYVCVSVTQVVQTALSETQDPDIVCMCHCLSPRWSRRPCQRPRTLRTSP